MFTRAKGIFREYPGSFWVLITVFFIDRIGGSLIFPFIALYITSKFNVGMTEVGLVFAVFSVAAFIGNILGGALTDKYGRKSMLILGLVSSAASSLAMGLIQTWEIFYGLAFLAGFVSSIGSPAASAMLTDILPAEKRADGFGILRVAINLAVTVGPAIGGILAGISYLLLFISDCLVSFIAAAIVYAILPETKPEDTGVQAEVNIMQSLGGYGKVFKNKLFTTIIILTMFTAIVYLQITSTLSVYLNDQFSISAQAYGYLMSLNAVIVVLFQFPVTVQVKKKVPLYMMALGNLLYALSVSMYAFVSVYPLFIVSIVIFTMGEMVIAPIILTLVSNIAPLNMRGRYMAAFELGRGIASAIGPLAAGVILDNYNPHWVWYGGGIICCIIAVCYLVLNRKAGAKFASISAG